MAGFERTSETRGGLGVLVLVLALGAVAWHSGCVSVDTVESDEAHREAASPTLRTSTRLDPAAWGADHVGRPVPEYVTGDECLFCHRSDIGPGWAQNRHATTMRATRVTTSFVAALAADSPLRKLAAEGQLFVLGRGERRRLLKSAGYGKLAILEGTEGAAPEDAGEPRRATWNTETFGTSCAGCHATGVDAQAAVFSDWSLDCYTCHGDVELEHTSDTRRMFLSSTRADPPRVVISICAQCHVRTGRSRSSGHPYPNNFVAGDNLWRDFEANLSDHALASLSPADRHVLENVRDVIVYGKETMTCLTCHDVHNESSAKHRRLPRQSYCRHCHDKDEFSYVRERLDTNSATCGYFTDDRG